LGCLREAGAWDKSDVELTVLPEMCGTTTKPKNYLVITNGVRLEVCLYRTVLVEKNDIRLSLAESLRHRGIRAFVGGRTTIDVVPVTKGEAVREIRHRIAQKRGMDPGNIAMIAIDDEYRPFASGRSLLEEAVA